MGEVWAVPLLLRMRLMERLRHLAIRVQARHGERELADFLANRLLSAARLNPDQLLPLVAELPKMIPAPTPHLADQLVGHLFDEEAALLPVRAWLERKLGAPLVEVLPREHRHEAMEQGSLANAITSIRMLTQLDWREVFEAVSRVDAVLWTDPAGVYPRVDFATRDQYRHAVEEIAKHAPASEIEVALKALEMAEAGASEIARHIGYYFVDDGRLALERAVGCRPVPRQRALRFARRRHTLLYLGSLLLLTIAITAGFMATVPAAAGAWARILLGLLAVLPASDVAAQVVNYLVTRLVPPRLLPKMSFRDGIPDEFRSLVVVPTMLLTPESIRDEVQRLEIRYLANPEPNLRYALITDFADAPQPHMPEDVERLDVAVRGIRDLNERHGEGTFFLLHRDRVWSETEQRYMGWERKRGKLEQMNEFLLGEGGPELDAMLRVGDIERLRGIRFVVTLDADTQVPPGSIRRMIETLAHPLNRPVLSEDGRRVTRGYTILQPRVTTALPSATATLFSRIFSDAKGTDPYTHVVSDVYQDLTGEANYHGKGIYDLHAFHSVLTGRFPQAHLLSHDLIEGAHARAGYVSDIELLDLFPPNYVAYARRQHRWVRGDWQIMDWLLPRVPTAAGRIPNPLSKMNRWKVLDNLRRSLLPAACTLLLAAAWLLGTGVGAAAWMVYLVLFLPPMLGLAGWLTSRPWKEPLSWRDLGMGVARQAVFLAFLPHQAFLSVDAIVRVFHRRFVSRRLLLEWETAAEAFRRAKDQQARFIRALLWIPVLAVLLWLAVERLAVTAQASALPFILGWIVSPGLVPLLNTPTRRRIFTTLTNDDRLMLRDVARRTWRLFDDFVGPQTSWLPPDNYQENLNVEVANRTSPTNVGLWVLAALAARDFGYLTVDEVLERLDNTFETLEKMDKHEGHLLNWYDTTTLAPLLPRYVSMVDSGNFLACLWAMEQGLDQEADGPLIGPPFFRGIQDTLGVLREAAGGGDAAQPGAREVLKIIEEIQRLCEKPPAELPELISCVRAVEEAASRLRDAHAALPENMAAAYWAAQVQRQAAAYTELVQRYLPWVEPLASPPEGALIALGTEAHVWRREALTACPSLRALATGNAPGLRPLIALFQRKQEFNLSDQAANWLDTLGEAASRAQWLAGEQLSCLEEILGRCRALGDGMNFRFMYDPKRRLFWTGYHVDDRRMDGGYYDMLASECRTGSFVCVARGDAPGEHWWALGRPFGSAYGVRPLLSWSGTMFEFLMPLLLTRSFENSLLDQACQDAVAGQIAYGFQRGIPWGISEAAHSALDNRRIYQYQAFGVPGLGIKRGLENDLVVSPYSTALALMVSPGAAARNLRHLARLKGRGLLGDYGFYESIDYTRAHTPGGERGVIVAAYFAHHQGMTLLAIDNVLNDNAIQRRFHRDPRVKAAEPLLFEKIPSSPAITRGTLRETAPPRVQALGGPPASGRVDTPDTPVPRVGLLANTEYSVMVTNAGGGVSRWKDIEVTRWRADTTRDAYGTFIYLKDVESGAVWSATHNPLGDPGADYSATFSVEKAEFRRRDHGIETVLEVVASPTDNAEIRRVTLANRSLRPRRIELTSYAEVALASHNADRAHPAFSKLFVETEAVPEQSALLASRRRRSAKDPELWAAHILAAPERRTEGGSADEPFQFETNRLLFLGRGRTPANPAALSTPLSNSAGPVLDPIFSLRRTVVIPPGERVRIAFVTAAGDSRQKVLAIAEKFCDLRACNTALDLAWTHAQLELRHMRISPDDALRFMQLASYVAYPHQRMRAPAERLRRNRHGQSRLWAYGISGDLPTVVVTIGDPEDIGTVREALMAHAFWRLRGLKADLVILNEEAATYEQPLQDQLRRMIQAWSQYSGVDQPGGVFLRPAANIAPEDLDLLHTAARVVLVAARGSLAQQLAAPLPRPPLPPALPKNGRLKEEPSPPLPFMELPYFNGLGGFTPDGREYAIYLGPGTVTPAPWVNVIANPRFGMVVTEGGAGFSWRDNSQSNRLTPWSNDPVSDPQGDVLYIRDEETGTFWTSTPLPIRELDAYRVRHGQGYTLFEHNSHAIEQELTLFVPLDDSEEGGAPVRIARLRLANRGTRRRRLTVTNYVDWVLGGDREETQLHVVTGWDAESRALFARNRYHPDFGGRLAFQAASLPAVSWTADRTEFIGRNGTPRAPAALGRTKLGGRAGAGLDPCGAIQVAVDLEPGAQTEVVFLLGEAADEAEARAVIDRFRSPARAEEALKTARAWWDRFLSAVTVKTPDLATDFLMNRWLLYQDLSCRIWARSAFYQSGGAFGYRDQLQDCMALVYARPDYARTMILRASSRQFPEGDVQHWWHPPSGAGVRTRISDDLLWLPFVTAQYVRVTGDTGILREETPFIEGKVLGPEEHEMFFPPTVSQETATLMEHCRRTIEKGLTEGPHGLPLIGGGDWNDGFNRVGVEGRGESVWMAWFLVHVLNDFAYLLDLTGEPEEAERRRAQAKKLAETVEREAWDGEWYLRAFFDDGTPLGSHTSAEAKIDSLGQSWSVISGAGDPARSEQALKAVEEHLVRPTEKMVLLFTPPFDDDARDPGYIKGYLPGVRENGGQYTHGSLWVPVAFARRKQGDTAVRLLRMMGPVEHARTLEEAARYKVEPYVVVADIYALKGQEGRGGWTWYTGSAGWMYRVWLEEVFGFQLRENTLFVDPALPKEWPEVTVTYRRGGATYEITIDNRSGAGSGVTRVEMDGGPLSDRAVPLRFDGGLHKVRVVLG
jgi:cellobiose phosphorylase